MANRKKYITIPRSYPLNSTSSMTTTEPLPKMEEKTTDTSNSLLWLIPLIGLLLLVVLVTSMWIKRKWQHKTAQSEPDPSKPTIQMPVCLSKNVIVQERLTSNPEYWASDPSAAMDLESSDQLKSFVIIRPEWIDLKQEIGEGCFGKVFRGKLRYPDEINGPNGEDVAVKVLKAGAGPQAREDLLQEAEIMRSFQHRNILSLRGIVVNESRIGPWMVFEYMSLGDLAQLLRASNGNLFTKTKSPYHFKEEDLHCIAQQIADGMAYLSSQHFVHRDLACRNCLVGHNLSVKISDFGMSRDVYTCDYYKTGGSRMLPVRWMSPESIMYGKFTLESDIWSFGVVLWEIYALGKQPYYGHSNEQVLKLILQGVRLTPPESATPFIRQLMDGCWKSWPSQRSSFSQIHAKFVERGARQSTAVTYVDIKHNCDGESSVPVSSDEETSQLRHIQSKSEYLQPLPDLPFHHYSNTFAQM